MSEYITGTGQRLVGVHAQRNCLGRGCAVHGPTNHPMTDLPTHWRADRGIMERICEHGVGHPDPDDQAFLGDDGVHGCDGCCSRRARQRRDKRR